MNVQHFYKQILKFSDREIQSEKDNNILQLNLHVTGNSFDKDKINMYEEHIQHKLNFGRINFDEIIKNAQIEAY